MVLSGARIALSATESITRNLAIRYGRVWFSSANGPAREMLDVSGMLILPGLINAHDHLELNLFPRLGRGPYPNAGLWARAIYQPEKSPVCEQLAVPKPLRLLWGGIKNLLSGVTSVAHHNPYCPEVFEHEFPVRVLKRFGWAHSIQFSPAWQEVRRRTPAHVPFIIHACEGTDRDARQELFRLEAARALTASTVLVHGVAIQSGDLALLQCRGVSLVWCPTSNCFTLGQTVADDVLSSRLQIALGTDSAITAAGDMIDELSAASERVPLTTLYGMVTEQAAAVLRLGSHTGVIAEGSSADLLAVPDKGQTPAQALRSLQPELVLVGGKVKLISTLLARRVPRSAFSSFHPIELEKRGRWLIPLDPRPLIRKTRHALGMDFRLAGKAVSA